MTRSSRQMPIVVVLRWLPWLFECLLVESLASLVVFFFFFSLRLRLSQSSLYTAATNDTKFGNQSVSYHRSLKTMFRKSQITPVSQRRGAAMISATSTGHVHGKGQLVNELKPVRDKTPQGRCRRGDRKHPFRVRTVRTTKNRTCGVYCVPIICTHGALTPWILRASVPITVCFVVLQDEGPDRRCDTTERQRGLHGRQHVPHRHPPSLPHHLRRP